jgi:signal transduction histidine kinase
VSDVPVILVVDDEPRNRVLLDAILAPEGYATVEAADGRACLRALDERPVDLVLLDVMMPGVDGVETCRRLRADPRWAELPVVFVTAYGDRDARVRAKDAGGDDFLTKPVDESELLARVRNLLRLKALRDARERQRDELARELARRLDELVRADRLATLGTLAGAVGHELNNLASGFGLGLDALERAAAAGAPPPAEALASLRRAYEGVTLHASQLLSLGRPGADRPSLVDLAAALDAVLDTLRSIGRLRDVRVELDLDPELPCALANPTRVDQVLTNLITNAADALHDAPGGERVLRVSARPGPAGRVTVCVADNGPGMPPAVLARIFEPYFTTKAPGRGTGLGLPVVRQIVESYGAALQVESRAGEGTAVTFELPAV